MKYTSKVFRDSYPESSHKRSSVLVKYFYRPLSFHAAVWAANMGLTANQVSYIGAVVAVTACAMFFVNNFAVRVSAAILFNVWLLLDCVDGNLARGVKKLPFGVFADALGSYFLVGFMGVPLGFAAYQEGGILFPAGNVWLIVMGALASSCDTMMRLVYKQYKTLERELADEGRLEIENDVFKNPNEAGNIKVRIGYEFGAGGIVPVMVLLATIFHALDLMVLYCLCYYGGACIVNILIYASRAIRREREIIAREDAS